MPPSYDGRLKEDVDNAKLEKKKKTMNVLIKVGRVLYFLGWVDTSNCMAICVK